MDLNKTVTEFVILGFSNLGQYRPVAFTLMFMIYIMIIAGNVSISVLIIIDRCLHMPMYYFICMLSVLAICNTAVTIPSMLVIIWKGRSHISFNKCIMQVYLFHSFGITENYLLNVMAYDRFVAICNPLRYHTTMTPSHCKVLVSCCWLLGFLSPITSIASLSQLPFCGPNEINHLFCDSSPLQNLACIDNDVVLIVDFVINLCLITSTFLFVLITYVQIILNIMKIRCKKGRRKTFSTCASHLAVVLLFYGSVGFMYIRPKKNFTSEYDKLVAINYSVLTPLFNVIIYSLRNKEIKIALKKIFKTKVFFNRIVQSSTTKFT
ncbi:olfactory receptor 6N1-like [Spea bombifrons]|uniref:olfactory receptor 6N1-like n=1 Tax=Spea bombifrons TaxID=233779 RepID=UPI00234BFE3E|nr:olfactory receptor 6N1-like [Spea bombifrons]